MSTKPAYVDVIATSRSSKPQKMRLLKDAPIYTRSFTGYFRNLRIVIASILAAIFFGTSWINWNGRQAVLWDIADRKFYVFGTTFWPQDLILLSFILMAAAIGLLAATMVVSRAWCGFACPQSVWTWVFMWVEKNTEGDRNKRMKLAAAPWSINKILRRAAKHGLWGVISLATGLAFIGYFVPVRDLSVRLVSGDWQGMSIVWVFMFGLATYLNAGWLREKVCSHMCPYSRIQIAVFDKDTLAVTYNADRGEGRGARRKDEDYKKQGLGDCVDCYQCVQVCPTGIDIRDGLQVDCIGCAACIDVCDSVMDKMNYPRGLIGYVSENLTAGKAHKLLRPMVVGYISALVIVFVSISVALYEGSPIGVSVSKDRNIFRLNVHDEVVNVYIVKVMNKTQESHRYAVNLVNSDDFTLAKPVEVELWAGEVMNVPVTVVMKEKRIDGGLEGIALRVTDLDNRNIYSEAQSTFVYPAR